MTSAFLYSRQPNGFPIAPSTINQELHALEPGSSLTIYFRPRLIERSEAVPLLDPFKNPTQGGDPTACDITVISDNKQSSITFTKRPDRDGTP